MLIFLVKLILALVCGALDWWGGHGFLAARRFIMPTIMAIACALFTGWWWTLLAMFVPMAVCLSLGYGDNSEFRHIFGDGWGRGVWGLLVGLAASLGLFLSGHLHLYWFIPYLVLSFTLENLLKKWDQDVGDPLIGLGFASILLVI